MEQRRTAARTRRSRAVFLDHRRGAVGPRDLHARRPLAALPARHRRQGRGRTTSRGWRNPSPAGATGWASSRPSRSRAPKAAFRCSRTCSNWRTTGARPTSGLPSIPEADEIARRDGRFHPAPQGIPGGAAEADGRAALSRRRQGRQRVQPVHAGRDGQGLGQPQDLPALLSGSLGDLRRQRQPAADLHGDGRGFLRGDGRAAGRRRTASSTTRSTSRCRSMACSTPSLPTASTTSPRRTRPIRCRRRRSPSISTRISRRCIPSSCAASCSGRSIRRASPRTIRR